MSGLTDRPELMPDETLHGFASRTARCYGTELAVLCDELALSFRGLVSGRATSVDRFSDLTGIAPSTLTRQAFLPRDGLWIYKGQALHKLGVRRIVLKICPACLEEDAKGSGLPPDRSAYVRAHWLVKSVRTCVRHGVELLEVPDAETLRGDGYHDLSKRLAATACDLDPMLRRLRSRAATRLEAYVVDRLHGAPVDGGFAARMPLYAAARTAEMLGVAALFGPKTVVRSLDGEAWLAAGEVGFDVLSLGDEAITSCLMGLMDNHGVANRMSGPSKVFGLLHRWLKTEDSGPDYEPFRALLREAVVDTIPLAAGTDVLGVKLEERRLHSLHSAAAETGGSVKGIRRELRSAGVLPFADGKGPGHLIAIPAEKAAAATENLAKSLSRKAAGEHVDASVADLRRLVQGGFLEPIVPKPGVARSHVRFSVVNLDAFLDDLHRGVTGETLAGSDMREIPMAAKSVARKLSEVTALVIGRKLRHVTRRPGVGGFRSVLVDRVELSGLLWGEDDGSLGMRTGDVSEALRASVETVGALVGAGFLMTRLVESPNGRSVKIFDEDSLKQFAAKYMSLSEVAHRYGRHSKTMLSVLNEKGVRLALPTDVFDCFFYRRSEIEGEFGP